MTENSRPVQTSEQSGGSDEEKVVIRDRRKVDLTSGTARPAGEPSPAGDGPAEGSARAADDESDSARSVGTEGGTAVEGEIVEGEVVGGDTGSPDGARPSGSPDGARPSGAGGGAEAAAAPAAEAAPEAAKLRDELAKLRSELSERTADLQRVTAEYANYRKRVDRDRTLAAEQATGTVLAALLPVLDDLDRAREHGDLVGPFAAVADQLVAALTKFGLTGFGAKGDPFDPTRHEAVAHLTSPDVTEPSCVDVMRRGYLLGDRLLRAAMVAVADPE